MGRTVAGGERAGSLVTGEGEKGLTGGARLPERGRGWRACGRRLGPEAAQPRGGEFFLFFFFISFQILNLQIQTEF